MLCPTRSAKVTVKSCYNLVLNRRLSAPNVVMEWKSSWTIKIACRLLSFGWKIAMDCLWWQNIKFLSHIWFVLYALMEKNQVYIFFINAVLLEHLYLLSQMLNSTQLSIIDHPNLLITVYVSTIFKIIFSSFLRYLSWLNKSGL